MSELANPITTQEQLDELIKARLERERNTVRKEFSDYETIKASLTEAQTKLTEAETKAKGLEAQIAELNSKAKEYETASVKTRIGLESGLPLEMISRLTGESEDEIRTDAENLAKLLRPAAAPMFNPEPKPGNEKDAAYKELLSKMKFN